MTNEQIEVLRELAGNFHHIGDQDDAVQALTAAISLAERVRDAANGELVELGDDENGQPRALIHGSRDSLRKGASVVFKRVALVGVE